jgi:dTDP-4-dehydrorhamnose reductase
VKALVAGAGGQLGQALVACLGPELAWSGAREALDVRDGAAVARVVESVRPDVVFNAAAYNAVDGAETDPGGALAVNAAGPAHLARAARSVGAVVVHVSSDYVFDGTLGRPYVEDDRPAPLSQYGVSKLAGELAVAAATPEHLVVRTSAVFGGGGSRAKGGSFVERMLARARAGQPLRVVSDQVLSPTYAPDLATALVTLVARGVRGLFHVTNAGECSWHALACAALEIAGVEHEVEPVGAAAFGAPARRPAYSALANARWAGLGLAPQRPWRAALREFLAP